MVHTYTSYANTELDMDALKAFDLWIADYRTRRPTRKHGIWQYTSEGTVPGITGDVDLNHAYKITRPSFRGPGFLLSAKIERRTP